MRELDRVLDRHNVRGARRVDLVNERGQRRGLARARRAGHQHQASLELRELGQRVWQAESGKLEVAGRQRARDKGHHAALTREVETEASTVRERVADVDIARALEARARHVGEHRVHERLHLFGGRRRQVDGCDVAVYARGRGLAHRDEHIRCAPASHRRQQPIYRGMLLNFIHHRPPPCMAHGHCRSNGGGGHARPCGLRVRRAGRVPRSG